MPLTSVAELLELLRDMHLLTPSQLPLVADLQAEFTDPQAAAEMLVRRKWLTPYQVEVLFGKQPFNLVLGPYVLLEPLGEGGMGQVFKARHHLLERIVALKIIRQDRISNDPEAVHRFQREARAAALLSHPNIVLLYDMDRVGDTYYIAMEYVEGIDLARLVRENGPLGIVQACDFIRQAAQGLQHAHEQGMVHRDIKPSNLLAAGLTSTAPPPSRGLSGIGQRPAIPGGRNIEELRGRAGLEREKGRLGPQAKPIIKITDMGLVRILGGDDSRLASLTQEGSIVGTPDYIAPEQARNAHKVDIRADLYSLGGTFYFLLTGQPPFPEGSAIEKLLMHQLDDPQPINQVRPDVPAEVASLVHKLLAKAPRDRFQTPAELIDELEDMLPEDRAPAPSSGKKTKSLQLRTASLNVSAPAPPTTPALRPEAAEPPKPQAESRKPPSKPVLVTSGRSAEPAPPPSSGPPVASSVYGWKANLPDSGEASPDKNPARHIAILKGHTGCAVSLAFSPNRDLLASGSVDATIRVWDFAGKKPRERAILKKHLDSVHSLAFSPDNRAMASGSGGMDGLIWLWDATPEQPLPTAALQGHKTPVDALSFSPDGKMLASGGSDTTVRIWEFAGARSRSRMILKGHTRPVKSIVFAADNQLLASAGQDYTVRVWDISRMWSKERSVLPHQAEINSVSFSPDSKLLVAACQDQLVHIWDLAQPKVVEKAVLKGHNSVVRLAQVTPDGKSIVSVAEDRQVIIWDIESGAKVLHWNLPKVLATSYALTGDGRYLAVGGNDGIINVFRVAEKRSHSSST
jgi:serine/threonine-protein kinase